MEIVRGLEALPLPDGPSVVTVGFFDGVHLGHREVLRRTVEAAAERGARSVAVTFDRHPREILTPGEEPRLLTTVERKAALIEGVGIDVLLVLAFTEELSRVPAEEFVRNVLAERLHAVHARVGGNFTFGHKATGTVQTLRDVGEPLGMTADEVELFTIDGRVVSSSSIREALASGDLAWPMTALGRRVVVDGEVVSGAGRGKGLGYPTANLRTWPRLLLPGQGIYAGVAELFDGSRYTAAIDVGTNPTFGVEPLHVEAFLIDFPDEELRGQQIAVEFWERLRDEIRFDSVDELIEAIGADVERTKRIISGIWRLRRGDDILGELVEDGVDFPWREARFTPTDSFESVRELFERERAELEEAIERRTDEWDTQEELYGEIRRGLQLEAPDGHLVPEFLLHIDGDRAWWRWSDEPFDAPENDER
jgi:riboflavin kinase/FMN adenylyltransferase